LRRFRLPSSLGVRVSGGTKVLRNMIRISALQSSMRDGGKNSAVSEDSGFI